MEALANAPHECRPGEAVEPAKDADVRPQRVGRVAALGASVPDVVAGVVEDSCEQEDAEAGTDLQATIWPQKDVDAFRMQPRRPLGVDELALRVDDARLTGGRPQRSFETGK